MLAEMLLSLKHPNYHLHEGSHRNVITSYIQSHEPSRLRSLQLEALNRRESSSQAKWMLGTILTPQPVSCGLRSAWPPL